MEEVTTPAAAAAAEVGEEVEGALEGGRSPLVPGALPLRCKESRRERENSLAREKSLKRVNYKKMGKS